MTTKPVFTLKKHTEYLITPLLFNPLRCLILAPTSKESVQSSKMFFNDFVSTDLILWKVG